MSRVGAKFGRLTVVEWIDAIHRRVVCDCGQEKMVDASNLTSGRTRSCGCYRIDNPPYLKHGMSQSPEYNSWSGMRRRCEDMTDANYGGRGIDVCAGWAGSFDLFVADMGPRPLDRTIDRVDNDLGYHCGHCWECVALGRAPNCRWATKTEQAYNRQIRVPLEVGNEVLSQNECARRFGINKQTIAYRLAQGWNPAEAATRPVEPRKSHKRVQ